MLKAQISEKDQIYCIKGFDEDAETFVPESDDPLIAKLELQDQLMEGQKEYEKSGFILEKKVEDGIELTPEMAWWEGKPIYASVCLELKKKHAGNLGKLTGCAADFVFEVPIDSEIMRMSIPPAIHEMAKRKPGLFIYDAALMFDPEDDTPYYLESCSNRPGWNCFFTEMELVGSPTAFFEAIVKGENPFKGGRKFAASVRVFNDNLDKDQGGKAAEGVPLYMPEEDDPNIWFMDLKEDDGKMVSCGYGHDLAVVTGSGDTPEDAFYELSENAERLIFKKRTFRPYHDLVSDAYSGAILPRYEYGLEMGLFGEMAEEEKEEAVEPFRKRKKGNSTVTVAYE
jgi:hypothetical protein